MSRFTVNDGVQRNGAIPVTVIVETPKITFTPNAPMEISVWIC